MPRKITYNAPVVLTFSLLSLVVLLLGDATAGAITENLFMLKFTAFSDPLLYLRLFSYVLGHANWEHYSGNMMLLLLTGPMLEEKYGSRQLLTVVIFTALTTGIIHLLLLPDVAVLGASGIVFAFILLASITGSGERQVPLTLIVVAVIYLGGEVLSGFFESDSISQLSHIIGGVIGCGFGYIFKPRRPARALEVR
ncbi:rhomboid family intramembrane serine protease [Oscillospiraceae bacterium LTW-04]|nr:rhomboid family intramembrane serine protease [Oscillospiraceae bacterium MB24-C1]